MAKKITESKKKSPKKNISVARSSKQERLFQNLLKITSQFMQGKGFSALTEAELIHRLSLPPQHADLFREVLQELLKQGCIELSRGRYSLKKTDVNVIAGTLRVHPRGFAFLQADKPKVYLQDIFIPKHLTQNAVDGDRVEVEVNEVISDKGPEGRVVAILSRGRTHMAGTIREKAAGQLIAYVPLLGPLQRVIVHPHKEHELVVGDRIVMEVMEWGSKTSETVCRMSHYLGHISDPSCDIKAVIEEFNLRSDFPTHVMEEARSFGSRVSLQDIAEREDLRHLEAFTIDPDTAKDFDDALSLTKDKKGHYFLGVHIADVSHYVRAGTALDDEAQQRCNSTYFPGVCIPMLPSELSNNLCSLKANVNRLTVSVLVHFDSQGDMVDYRIARTVIKSAKRFSYREAKEVLDGKKQSRHKPTLDLMVELCGLLKGKRYERGSIEFSLPDLVIKVDEKGVPLKTEYVAYDITHQLVEEFMLKANELVALHLSKQGKNLTYRVHDEPAEENMKDFSILASAFGFRLSEKPTSLELQKFFDEALDTAYGQYLATSYIRRMRLAMYSPENIGHYGLGLTHYCHFTSPIRRYVDLVVHRILFGGSDDRTELEAISVRSSEQERISAKAENNVVLLKKLRLLKDIHSKEQYRQYEAVVTRIKNFGLFFEVLDYMLEGFLHISELDNDFFVFDEGNMRLKGNRSGKAYCSGDRITVMLKAIDLVILETKWHLVSEHPRQGEQKSKKSERRHSFQKQEKKPLQEKPKQEEPKKIIRKESKRKTSEKGIDTSTASAFIPKEIPIERRPLPPARTVLFKKTVEQKLKATSKPPSKKIESSPKNKKRSPSSKKR